MPAGDRAGDAREGRAVDRDVAEVDEPHADLLGEGRDELGLGEHALVDQHAAEAATEPVLLEHGGVELVPRDQATLDEDVTQLLHGASLHGLVGR